jgi:hypothetical protein
LNTTKKQNNNQGGVRKMKKGFLLAIFSICLSLMFATMASANLITNGSFELGAYTDNGGGYTRLNAYYNNFTAITGWTAGADGLDWHVIEGSAAHFGHNGVNGSQYAVDLSKDGESGNYTIAQTFATTVGTVYELSFLLGAPYFNTGVNVSVAGLNMAYSISGQSTYNFPWVPIFLSFIAVNSTTTLEFANIQGGYWAPVIDNVSVDAVNSVPEPSTMLLLGLGLFGAGIIRKLKKQ